MKKVKKLKRFASIRKGVDYYIKHKINGQFIVKGVNYYCGRSGLLLISTQ